MILFSASEYNVSEHRSMNLRSGKMLTPRFHSSGGLRHDGRRIAPLERRLKVTSLDRSVRPITPDAAQYVKWMVFRREDGKLGDDEMRCAQGLNSVKLELNWIQSASSIGEAAVLISIRQLNCPECGSYFSYRLSGDPSGGGESRRSPGQQRSFG